MEYAGVHLLDNPYFLDVEFDYYIPSEYRGRVAVGDFVVVPFGNANKRRLALVTSLKPSPDKKGTACKPIFDLVPKKLSLTSEMMGLCFFMKEQTLSTLGDAARSMIPASALSRLSEVYSATSLLNEDYKTDESALLVCEHIRKKGSVKFDLLKKHFGADVMKALDRLVDDGALKRDYIFTDTTVNIETVYSLAIDRARAEAILSGEDKEIKLRSEKHAQIISLLLENAEISAAEILRAADVTSAQIKAVCDKGIVRSEQREVAVPEPLEELTEVERKEIILNDEQAAAYQRLSEMADSEKPSAALLFGVTGSGKTSVMLKLIDRMGEKGKGVIVLLPEIALTPQTLSIFRSRYGSRVAVVHSGLSPKKRYETYNKIREGKADVVVGTRSAVFSPVKNLGAIIIDEEQEHTYKSDMSPKYHARVLLLQKRLRFLRTESNFAP